MKKATTFWRLSCYALILALLMLSTFSSAFRVKETQAASLGLPEPTEMLSASRSSQPMVLKGLSIDPENPLNLKFIIENYEADQDAELALLAKFFLGALTVPEDDLWVNLSPYEDNRIITDTLNNTDLGKHMLRQDYLLKLFSSSVTDPDTDSGREYWGQNIQSFNNEFSANKIWIVPQKAEIYEQDNNVLVTEATLKVKSENNVLTIDKINQEINNGRRFAELRQMYKSIILAKWFKQKFKDSFYKHYIDKNKVKGISLDGDGIREEIFALYCKSFEKGVYSKVKSEYSRALKKKIKRNYFSGGIIYSPDMSSAISPSDINLDKLNVVELKLSADNDFQMINMDVYHQLDFQEALEPIEDASDKIVQVKKNDRRIFDFIHGDLDLDDMYFERKYYDKYGMFKVLSKNIKLDKLFRAGENLDLESDKVWVRFLRDKNGVKYFSLHLRPGAKEVGRWSWDEDKQTFKNVITPTLKIKEAFERSDRSAAEYVGKVLEAIKGSKEDILFKMKVGKGNKIKNNPSWKLSDKLRFTVKGKDYYISSTKFIGRDFVFVRLAGDGKFSVYLDEGCSDLAVVKYYNYSDQTLNNSRNAGFERFFDWAVNDGPHPKDMVLAANSYPNTSSKNYTNKLNLLSGDNRKNHSLKLLWSKKLENKNVLVSFRHTSSEEKAIYVYSLGSDNSPKYLIYKGYFNKDRDEFVSLLENSQKVRTNELHLLLVKLERYFPNLINEFAEEEFIEFVDYIRSEEKKVEGPFFDVYDFDDVVVNKILRIKNFDYLKSTFLEQLQVAKAQAARFRMYNYLFSEFEQVFPLLHSGRGLRTKDIIINSNAFRYVRFKDETLDSVIEKLETLPHNSSERYEIYRDFIRDKNFESILELMKEQDESGKLSSLQKRYMKERSKLAYMCLDYKNMYIKKYSQFAKLIFKDGEVGFNDLDYDIVNAANYAVERYNVADDYLVKSFVYQYFEKHNHVKRSIQTSRMTKQDQFDETMVSEFVAVNESDLLSRFDNYVAKKYLDGHAGEEERLDEFTALVSDLLDPDSDKLSDQERQEVNDFLDLSGASTYTIPDTLKFKIKNHFEQQMPVSSSSIDLRGGIDMSGLNVISASSALESADIDWSNISGLNYKVSEVKPFQSSDQWWN